MRQSRGLTHTHDISRTIYNANKNIRCFARHFRNRRIRARRDIREKFKNMQRRLQVKLANGNALARRETTADIAFCESSDNSTLIHRSARYISNVRSDAWRRIRINDTGIRDAAYLPFAAAMQRREGGQNWKYHKTLLIALVRDN